MDRLVANLTCIEFRLEQLMPDQPSFKMAFDLSHPTNRFIHSYMVKNEVCDLPFTSRIPSFFSPQI
jgi:hypothetical protein